MGMTMIVQVREQDTDEWREVAVYDNRLEAVQYADRAAKRRTDFNIRVVQESCYGERLVVYQTHSW